MPDPKKASGPEGEPETAAVVHKPPRGCPMPMHVAKEVRAAAVLCDFLTPVQRADFDERRAFVVVGNHTGSLYRVTSRWSPDVVRYGTLCRLGVGPDDRRVVCASCDELPPAEEALAIKLSIEHFERRFLAADHEVF